MQHRRWAMLCHSELSELSWRLTSVASLADLSAAILICTSASCRDICLPRPGFERRKEQRCSMLLLLLQRHLQRWHLKQQAPGVWSFDHTNVKRGNTSHCAMIQARLELCGNRHAASYRHGKVQRIQPSAGKQAMTRRMASSTYGRPCAQSVEICPKPFMFVPVISLQAPAHRIR